MDTQTLQTKDFDFELPEELIAQTPIEPRDASRLMVLDKTTGEIEHRHFHDITEYLNEGDCLVLNNSRVLPARIYGIKNETGAHVEFLLLKNCGDDVWEALAGPGKRAKLGTSFTFEGSSMTCEVIEVKDDGNRLIRFHYDKDTNFFTELLGQIRIQKLRDLVRRPILKKSSRIKSATRRCIPKRKVLPPRRRPACTLRRSCSMQFAQKA